MLGDQKSGNNIISTHALTEGDRTVFPTEILIRISTHALTEGDTYLLYRKLSEIISTHALTEGDATVQDL